MTALGFTAYLVLAAAAGPSFDTAGEAGQGPGAGTAAAPSALDAAKAADAAFSQASADRRLDRFLAFVEEDALFSGGGRLARGRKAIRGDWAPLFQADGPTLTWAPLGGDAAASGDLVFTTGGWTLRAEGHPDRQGAYVTVWRRHGEAWRVVLDHAEAPAAALGPGLRRATARTVRSKAGDLEAAMGTWRRANAAGKVERGTWLTVRQRRSGGAWETVIDAAVRVPGA